MRTSDKIRIEKALVTIGETLNYTKLENWNKFNSAISAKDYAAEHGDDVNAEKLLKRAKHLKSRAAEIADIIDALSEFDRVFHRTF